MSELTGRRLRAADLTSGVVLAVIGAGMLVASLAMPTYAERGTIVTAPGIFPGFVAAVLLALGAALAVRGWRSRPAATPGPDLAIRPILTGLVLMVVAIALVGKIDFRLVCGGFGVAFAAAFVNWRGTRAEILRRLGATAITIVIVAIVLPEAFEQIFLVRLP